MTTLTPEQRSTALAALDTINDAAYALAVAPDVPFSARLAAAHACAEGRSFRDGFAALTPPPGAPFTLAPATATALRLHVSTLLASMYTIEPDVTPEQLAALAAQHHQQLSGAPGEGRPISDFTDLLAALGGMDEGIAARLRASRPGQSVDPVLNASPVITLPGEHTA